MQNTILKHVKINKEGIILQSLIHRDNNYFSLNNIYIHMNTDLFMYMFIIYVYEH